MLRCEAMSRSVAVDNHAELDSIDQSENILDIRSDLVLESSEGRLTSNYTERPLGDKAWCISTLNQLAVRLLNKGRIEDEGSLLVFLLFPNYLRVARVRKGTPPG